MKTTLSWLKTHLATSAPLSTLVERLVMLGHDVEGVADRAAALDGYEMTLQQVARAAAS